MRLGVKRAKRGGGVSRPRREGVCGAGWCARFTFWRSLRANPSFLKGAPVAGGKKQKCDMFVCAISH